METLSNILASFDIFQVLISAFPLITDPIIKSLEQVFTLLFSFFNKIILAHPGISMAILIFMAGYITVAGVEHLRRYYLPVNRTGKNMPRK